MQIILSFLFAYFKKRVILAIVLVLVCRLVIGMLLPMGYISLVSYKRGEKIMANLNKVMLMGNLTRDPINKATSSGLAICEFGLAINRYYKNAQGEKCEEVCFVDLEAFGKTAEICGRYLRKGMPAYFEGRLKLDQWTDKTTGQNRYRLRVTVDTMQFLDRRQDNVPGNPQTTSFDNMGHAMQPASNMPPPGAYNPPPPPPQTQGAMQVQDSYDGPPLEIYEEEDIDQDVQF